MCSCSLRLSGSPSLLRFVAKDPDGRFHCHVFSCANKDKAHAVALTVAKAFYLAYQVGVVLGKVGGVSEAGPSNLSCGDAS